MSVSDNFVGRVSHQYVPSFRSYRYCNAFQPIERNNTRDGPATEVDSAPSINQLNLRMVTQLHHLVVSLYPPLVAHFRRGPRRGEVLVRKALADTVPCNLAANGV